MFKSKYFEMGQVVVTHGISNVIRDSEKFSEQVFESLARHSNKDWGVLDEFDKSLNDEALENGVDRLFSAYETCHGKIWIITEADRSATTVLFPSEY